MMGKEVLCYPAVIQGAKLAPKYDLSTQESGLQASQDLAKRVMYILEHPATEKERKGTRKFWIDTIEKQNYKESFEKIKKEARLISEAKHDEYKKTHPDEAKTQSESE